MKEAIKYVLAMAVSAIAMFAYMYELPPEGVVEDVAQIASKANFPSAIPKSGEQPSDQPKRELTAAELANIDPASIDWKSVANRIYPGIDQMLLRFNVEAEYSPAEIAAFNKLHVIEFNPTTQSICREVESEQAVGGFITICEGIKERPEHPYARMDYEDLFELAEADAAAAVFASRKAERIEDRMGMALRAAALSGKPGPVLYTAAKEFTTPNSKFDGTDHGRATTRTEPATVISRIILESVAQRMGDPRADPDLWKIYVDDFAKTPEEQEQILKLVQEATRDAMEGMAQIQQEITGSTQVRGLLDA